MIRMVMMANPGIEKIEVRSDVVSTKEIRVSPDVCVVATGLQKPGSSSLPDRRMQDMVVWLCGCKEIPFPNPDTSLMDKRQAGRLRVGERFLRSRAR